MPSLPIFPSNHVRIVCISDTHNDDPRESIPPGDILIHAGDMTNDGTLAELKNAFNWLRSLPHKVKIVIAGNHDFGLDRQSPKFSQDALDLFISSEAQSAGITYLDREVRTVGYLTSADSQQKPIKVYGNPMQPEFLGTPYAFTYQPHPSEGSVQAWTDAPKALDEVSIWAMHSPPRHRLDAINVKPLVGCVVQAEKIAAARPLLCVFGHYHYSWGVERVCWQEHGDRIAETKLLALSRERKEDQSLQDPGSRWEFDFTGKGDQHRLAARLETVFVNAAWMTMKKTLVKDRNHPIVIIISL